MLSAIITQHVKLVVAPECNNSVIGSFLGEKNVESLETIGLKEMCPYLY